MTTNIQGETGKTNSLSRPKSELNTLAKNDYRQLPVIQFITSLYPSQKKRYGIRTRKISFTDAGKYAKTPNVIYPLQLPVYPIFRIFTLFCILQPIWHALCKTPVLLKNQSPVHEKRHEILFYRHCGFLCSIVYRVCTDWLVLLATSPYS